MPKTLKIAIYWDLRSTIPERHTGVGKHVVEVVTGLQAEPNVEVKILLAKDQAELWPSQAAAFGWKKLQTQGLPFGNRSGRLLAAFGFSRAEKAVDDCDLVFAPSEILPPFRSRPCITTIHGIPYFEPTLPNANYNSLLYRLERFRQAWFMRRCRRACRACFVVSDYLRDRIIQEFELPAEQLVPVYNGADALFFQQSGDQPPPLRNRKHDEVRLLQVGGANVFDGGMDVLKIARFLQEHDANAKIYIAGDRHEPPWDGLLKQQKNVFWLGFLSSDKLLEEMNRSTALLYLPAVESFGIIGVEAMAAGLPIIAKRSTALPEVLGSAAAWVDPDAPESIREAFDTACTDTEQRDELIRAGRERATRYTWPAVVERVAKGLHAAAS